MIGVLAQGSLADQLEQQRGGAGTTQCVADNGFCPDWIADNLDRYMGPLGEHAVLTFTSVGIGFVIAFTLAILAHKRRWLTGPITVTTGVLYTVPSIAAYFLLQPVFGFGNLTAIVVLTSYTLLILFRNVTTGLRNVPRDAIDAARGMGMTDNQILTKVELPLALPEILAGLRIAVATIVGLATLAFLAGAGGLGENIFSPEAGTGGKFFKSNVVVAGVLCVLMAAVADALILLGQRIALPWRRAVPS